MTDKTDEQVAMQGRLARWLHRVEEDRVQFIHPIEKREAENQPELDYVEVTATFYVPKGMDLP